MREHVLSVTLKDCEVQTFRAGGKGGQNQNKRDTGVRLIHRASGARGESREARSQLENKRIAFRRMAESPTFCMWVYSIHANFPPLDVAVDAMMAEKNLKVEGREDGRWIKLGS